MLKLHGAKRTGKEKSGTKSMETGMMRDGHGDYQRTIMKERESV